MLCYISIPHSYNNGKLTNHTSRPQIFQTSPPPTHTGVGSRKFHYVRVTIHVLQVLSSSGRCFISATALIILLAGRAEPSNFVAADWYAGVLAVQI